MLILVAWPTQTICIRRQLLPFVRFAPIFYIDQRMIFIPILVRKWLLKGKIWTLAVYYFGKEGGDKTGKDGWKFEAKGNLWIDRQRIGMFTPPLCVEQEKETTQKIGREKREEKNGKRKKGREKREEKNGKRKKVENRKKVEIVAHERWWIACRPLSFLLPFPPPSPLMMMIYIW